MVLRRIIRHQRVYTNPKHLTLLSADRRGFAWLHDIGLLNNIQWPFLFVFKASASTMYFMSVL